ncbi:hypothetical protein PAXRUDRAFT_17663 [Paxillus rubicundulus Ve08.2h10]|uniref:Unplaced genomic scaffold scaffold_2271, whole genome shotgun sequence n=1 Tax=Paxillus rubicundulus Ve08.2h10 TaxID=930991 RepID=A0A0D0D9M4_9AGAM|nr:hypothetical protein PAXRUDRAFT_17663 [Paxillus rubicundulus Ve08.2h10]
MITHAPWDNTTNSLSPLTCNHNEHMQYDTTTTCKTTGNREGERTTNEAMMITHPGACAMAYLT